MITKEKLKRILRTISPVLTPIEEYYESDLHTSTDAEVTQDETTAAKEKQPSIISGVQGLADYLGCSKGTAMKIVKSRVLPNGKVQYKVGENWKFNREKLDKFLADNPEVLGRQKPCNK